MIRVEDLSYGVPNKDLYKDISFEIEKGQHCALIGSNGTGKSTLVRMIIDPEELLYDGKIIKDDECRIGYASQFAASDIDPEMTVLDYLSERFVQVQKDIALVCERMAVEEDMEAALEEYQKLFDLNESMDGDNYESNIHKQLYIAGMLDLKARRLSELSGGEYKVLQVIREMLLAPNLLILDEPDVFLDFANIGALCKLINEYDGTMLVITHNRYLLNHCFNKILHLENCDMIEFDGNFAEYRCAQFRKKLALTIQYNEEQDEIDRTQEMVSILRKRATLMVNPTIGRSVNAKQSQLDRLRARVIDAPYIEFREPEFTLPAVEPEPDRVVLRVENYSVSFDDFILEDVSFEIRSGEKAAIVGANGAGKTTLVRDIISGVHPSVHIGEGVKYECLSQLIGESKDNEKSISRFLQDRGFGGNESIREHLADYCLEDINLDDRLGKLSVGEQNLVRFAAMAKSDAELLILDEPTSHLDVYSQTALEKALCEYKGSVLMISHDFYLIANCADYVLLMEDNTLRRASARKFRKNVYENFFDVSYLESDRKRQEIEAKITQAFKENRIDLVEKLCDQLEDM